MAATTVRRSSVVSCGICVEYTGNVVVLGSEGAAALVSCAAWRKSIATIKIILVYIHCTYFHQRVKR